MTNQKHLTTAIKLIAVLASPHIPKLYTQ